MKIKRLISGAFSLAAAVSLSFAAPVTGVGMITQSPRVPRAVRSPIDGPLSRTRTTRDTA